MKLASLALQSAALLLALAPQVPAQCQQTKLLVPDAQFADYWGKAVVFDGTTAIVSSIYDHLNSSVSGKLVGAAQVFELGPGGWSAAQKLKPSVITHGGEFGHAMAFDGEWLAVSAPNDHAQGVQQSGSVFVFRKQGGQWLEHQKLVAAAPTYQASFGEALALRGDRLVVGAPDDTIFGLRAGAAHVFELQAGPTWVEVAKLFAGDAEIGGVFGQSVAIDGDTLLVGSPGENQFPGLGNNIGATYVFERSAAGAWAQVQKLETSSPQEWQFGGAAVLLEGDTAFIGVPSYDGHFTNTGAIAVFERTPTGWVERQFLRIPDWEFALGLGRTLDFDGGRLFCGVDDTDLGVNSGSVYVFEAIQGAWGPTAKHLADDGGASQIFGGALAASGGHMLVASPATDEACPTNSNCNSGSAYLVPLGSDTVQTCSCPAPNGPCGNHDDWGGCANSTGQGAVLSACGSGSVALDDLVLRCQWMPANQPALLFMGGTTASNPMGDGQLCVFPGPTGIHRFPAAFSTGQGSIQHGPGLVGLSQAFTPPGPIQPGEDRHFQVWFRDPAGPCGTVTNLSNAVRVTFRP